MTKAEYMERFARHCLEFVEVTRRKMADYTGDDPNPFANFEHVARVEGRKVLDVMLTMLLTKVVRIRSLLSVDVEAENEPLSDSFRDLAIYSILGMVYIDGINGSEVEPEPEPEQAPKEQSEGRRMFESLFGIKGR